MIINLLCDNKKSWFWDTNKIFIEKLTELGHVVNIAKSEDELKEGDIAAFISSLKIVTKDGLSKNKSNVVPHLTHLIFLKDEGLRQLLGKFLMTKMSFTLLYLKQMKKLMMEKYITKRKCTVVG